MKARHGEEIRRFILENVDDKPTDISRVTSEKFDVSRNAVAKHLRALIKNGLLEASGKTKDREYSLKPFLDEFFDYEVSTDLEEDVIWRDKILPLLRDLPNNIIDICSLGITEIVNNVVDHSESPTMLVSVIQDYKKVEFRVIDKGIGIFKKIQNDFGLDDPRQALLELTKGKLTSDKTKHSGEGIFFTSRMFSSFSISSGSLYFCRSKEDNGWLMETKVREHIQGTMVRMTINKNASHTMKDIYDLYASEFNEFGFTKTHVPLELLQYEGENLISRSQAKRLMVRVENFKEVILDFKGVNLIGQAFADQIFRVWATAHPTTKILAFNTNNEVKEMINRVQSREKLLDTMLKGSSLGDLGKHEDEEKPKS